MSDAEKTLNEKVEAITANVVAGRIGRSEPWGGTGIVISATPPQPRAEPGFYRDPQYVVTPYARQLSWLFNRLRGAFSDAIDYLSKFEFYGRLADAANRYNIADSTESQSVEGLLVAVLDEAKLMAKEFQAG